jgi:integrase
MARVGSTTFQVSKIIKSQNGIAISKKERRDTISQKAENNHNVSDLIHSYKSLTDTRNNLINLGNFAKEKYQIKDMSKIDINIVKEWVKSKDLVYRSASNYLSQLNKVEKHFNFDKNAIKEFRNELKNNILKDNKVGTLAQQTRSYKNLDKIVLRNEKSQLAFELQRDLGLRVKEATHINLDRQLKGNVLIITQKGGKLTQKEISPTLISKIKENAKNGIYSVNKMTYQRHLKEAIEKSGQKWSGTHGIRHSYAQNQIEAGKTKEEVSQELGHNREEIINTYLR